MFATLPKGLPCLGWLALQIEERVSCPGNFEKTGFSFSFHQQFKTLKQKTLFEMDVYGAEYQWLAELSS